MTDALCTIWRAWMAGAAVLVHGCHVAKQVHAEGAAQAKSMKLLHKHEKQARRMLLAMMQLRSTKP